jgi:hypothetical protein
MSIAAYQFFSALNATPVSISGREPNLIHWLDNSHSETCTHRPGIAGFLAGHGLESHKPPPKVAEAESRARGWWDLARVLAAHALAEDLIVFGEGEGVASERKRARDRGMSLEERHLHPAWMANKVRQRSTTAVPRRRVRTASFLW